MFHLGSQMWDVSPRLWDSNQQPFGYWPDVHQNPLFHNFPFNFTGFQGIGAHSNLFFITYVAWTGWGLCVIWTTWKRKESRYCLSCTSLHSLRQTQSSCKHEITMRWDDMKYGVQKTCSDLPFSQHTLVEAIKYPRMTGWCRVVWMTIISLGDIWILKFFENTCTHTHTHRRARARTHTHTHQPWSSV
jgi:hypothetical protein